MWLSNLEDSFCLRRLVSRKTHAKKTRPKVLTQNGPVSDAQHERALAGGIGGTTDNDAARRRDAAPNKSFGWSRLRAVAA